MKLRVAKSAGGGLSTNSQGFPSNKSQAVHEPGHLQWVLKDPFTIKIPSMAIWRGFF
jgi:hypothetical protein